MGFEVVAGAAVLAGLGAVTAVRELQRFIRVKTPIFAEARWTEPWEPELPGWRHRLLELKGLGYGTAGDLLVDPPARWTVLLHTGLPVYAALRAPYSPREDAVCRLHLFTFYPDLGLLHTTSLPGLGAVGAVVPGSGPRLLQCRPGGEPTALDGQHCGTLRAWEAGGRTALVAARERLLVDLRAEQDALAAAAVTRGWPTAREAVLAWLDRAPGELRF